MAPARAFAVAREQRGVGEDGRSFKCVFQGGSGGRPTFPHLADLLPTFPCPSLPCPQLIPGWQVVKINPVCEDLPQKAGPVCPQSTGVEHLQSLEEGACTSKRAKCPFSSSEREEDAESWWVASAIHVRPGKTRDSREETLDGWTMNEACVHIPPRPQFHSTSAVFHACKSRFHFKA